MVARVYKSETRKLNKRQVSMVIVTSFLNVKEFYFLENCDKQELDESIVAPAGKLLENNFFETGSLKKHLEAFTRLKRSYIYS